MNQAELFQEAGKALARAADQEHAFLEAAAHTTTREGILQLIRERLTVWWDQDPEQIPRFLYRIDVREDLARSALSSESPIPALAEAILNRLMQTAESRIAYREKMQRDQQDDLS